MLTFSHSVSKSNYRNQCVPTRDARSSLHGPPDLGSDPWARWAERSLGERAKGLPRRLNELSRRLSLSFSIPQPPPAPASRLSIYSGTVVRSVAFGHSSPVEAGAPGQGHSARKSYDESRNRGGADWRAASPQSGQGGVRAGAEGSGLTDRDGHSVRLSRRRWGRP